jgi:hypothetical protein
MQHERIRRASWWDARRKETTRKTIKIDLRGIGWDGMDCIDLAQDRDQWRALVNTDSMKCWEVIEQLHNWRLLKKVSVFIYHWLLQKTAG